MVCKQHHQLGRSIYDLNHMGSGDRYAKGANMLNTVRQIIDDEQWRFILRGLNEEFHHQTVKSEQIEQYISEKTGLNMKLKVYITELADHEPR